MMFKSIKELLAICDAESLKIHEVMMRQEMSVTGLTEEEVYARMDKNLQTMEHALEQGLTGEGVVSTTGLTGGDALLLQRYIASGASLAGDTMLDVVSRARSMPLWVKFVRHPLQVRQAWYQVSYLDYVPSYILHEEICLTFC